MSTSKFLKPASCGLFRAPAFDWLPVPRAATARGMVFVAPYAACPLSLRYLEEMMAERGVRVDHATVHRWALKMLPVLLAVFRRGKCPVGGPW